jgi:hypothetical protein
VTAPVGAVVKLFVDLVAPVRQGDIIETGTGRRYGVLGVRVQASGKHAGRQHLSCVVVENDTDHTIVATQEGDGITIAEVPARIHRIRWYKRGAR